MRRLVKSSIDYNNFFSDMVDELNSKDETLYDEYKNSGKYSQDQLFCIYDVLDTPRTKEMIDYIANPKFNPEQMDALRDVFNLYSLDDDEAKFISDIDFSAEQINEIGFQLGKGKVDLETLKKLKHLKEYSAEEIEDIVFDLNHDKITVDELNDAI